VRPARGLTIVELLVVMVIIAILMSAVLVVSGTVVNKARITSTQAMLLIVREAVDEFKREQTANRTLTRDNGRYYETRYGLYPPDELEVFTPTGVPTDPADQSRAVGRAAVFPLPEPEFGAMRFYTRSLVPEEAVAQEHRDLAAMVLAIELFGDASSAILDGIQDRYRSPGPVNPEGAPMLFLDRPDAAGVLNGVWDPSDLQIRYIVDDWGMPIAYMTQRDWDPENPGPTVSANHSAWNEASTKLVRLNDGQPVIMSYGPNGPEQLTKGQMEPTETARGAATLIVDLLDDGKINLPLNEDNVYADDALKEKLAEGTTP
jgi:prepilin-type N-terminal cleavage/methylation domain-containing protein